MQDADGRSFKEADLPPRHSLLSRLRETRGEGPAAAQAGKALPGREAASCPGPPPQAMDGQPDAEWDRRLCAQRMPIMTSHDISRHIAGRRRQPHDRT